MTQTIALVLTAVVSIATALGIGWAVFRTTAKTNTMELYARENDALTKSNIRLDADLRHATERLESLNKDYVRVEGMVTQRAEVQELRQLVERLEQARAEEHAVQQVILRDILAQLRNGRGAIGR